MNEREPIAIVGIGCRFPAADSLESFWSLLRDGVDAIGEIPADRFDVASYHDPTPATPGKLVSRQGGFLKDIDRFDPYFFGISPREAERMDPQQRLLLEVAWDAFEDAGIVPMNVAASKTGVFVGMWTNEYEDRMFNAFSDIDLYATTGGGRYSASGRLSYFFDLRGPSMTLDTACSSSLVAIHLACRSLRSGESNLALAGGVNLILEPHISIGYSRGKMLSPDGRCKFGDASANGYVRSEGAGMVLLKPLSKALADGDPIHAVIRGTAVNNDGRGSGHLVAPSPKGQEEMLRDAYADAGVSAGAVHYMEAHGTGTPVGDPVELEAMAAVLSEGRPKDRPCQLGSVKTNIGHTEAASGIAGLIKAVLVLKHRQVPGNPHFSEPSPKIPWSTLPMTMQRYLGPLRVESETALAGVNSFGITGTNAHVVLEQAPARTYAQVTQPVSLLPLSAHSPEALKAHVADFERTLKGGDAGALFNVCYTASARRTHHEYRLAVAGRTVQELVEALDAFGRGEDCTGLSTGHVESSARPKVVLVFPGQGSQWTGMGRVLLEREPVFRQSIERCEEAFRPHVDWSLRQQLGADEQSSRLSEVDVIQPVLFAIQVSLAALWSSWGIQPDAVVGHSMGEVAAAHVAGSLSLDDAASIICRRSRLLRRASGKGAMALTDLTLEQAASEIDGLEDRVSIAVSNGARSTVLSGDPAALEGILERLKQKEVFCRWIKVDVASHSPQMDPLLPDLLQELAALNPRASAIPIYSTVTGAVADGAGFTAPYWADNLRKPVLFSTAVELLKQHGYDCFLEVSAHPILLQAIREGFQRSGTYGVALPSLRREEDEQAVMYESLGALHARGCKVDWSRLYPAGGRSVALPAYPWQRERFWFQERDSRTGAKPEQVSVKDIDDLLYQVAWHDEPLLKASKPAPEGSWILFADIRGTAQSLAARLEASKQNCVLVYPGAAYQELADGNFQIRPGEAQDFQRVLGAFSSRKLPPCRGVFYMWSADAPQSESLTAAALSAANQSVCIGALYLVQALAKTEWQVAPRLWLVTSGAQQAAKNDTLSVAQASLLGLGRVAANEHPEFQCTRIDLSADRRETEIDSLCTEALSSSGADEIAYRDAARYVARLEKRPVAQAPATAAAKFDGTYLITGGFGSLGLETAKWLVAQGARNLVLAGRRGASAAAKPVLETMRNAGVSIMEATLDVARIEEVERLFAEIDQSMPPVRGVFHAAGILDDGVLLQLDRQRFESVMSSKVLGGWNLHTMTLTRPVDYFVLFSSVTALLGSPGQANYAAANAFLDGLAGYRMSRGLRALSIGWGPWLQIGLAATQGIRGDRLARRGLGSISPVTGLAALSKLCAQSESRCAVMPFDLKQWSAFYPQAASAPFFSVLHENHAENAGNARPEPAGEAEKIRASLLAIEPGTRRRSKLEDYLRQQTAAVLKTSPARIELNRPLKTLGLDSLLALELRNRFEMRLELKLPATLVWNYPTISALATLLAEKMGIPLEAAALGTGAELSDILGEIERFSLATGNKA